MRSNKKLARALAGIMISSQVLTTVPMTNVVPVFASEVNMNESTTSSKSVESTLIANAEDLGGDVVVTIPNKMTLALNNETKTLGASSEVYAKGICGVLDSLTVSVKSNKINFVNKNKATDTVEADVNFGTDNTSKWTADQLIDGLKDELALVKQPIKLETNKKSIKHVGDYQAETEFNISLGDNRNNWEAQATSLFNYKEITSGNNKGTIQITGLTDEGASYLSDEAGADGLLTIPEVIEDKAVTEIGAYAFKSNQNIKHTSLPESLIKISYGAFNNCKSLKEITIPSTLKKIDYSEYRCGVFDNSGITTATIANGANAVLGGLFANVPNLKTVILPESITSVYYNAFKNCESLSNINLPEGIVDIADKAFENCTSLKSVQLPSTLKMLRKEAFKNDTLLSNINLPEGTTLYANVFENCTLLKEITIPSTLFYNDYNDIYYNEDTIGIFKNSGLTTATIADRATEIPEGLFRNANNLTTVNLPEGLTTINRNAFENCTALTDITIPSTLNVDGDFVKDYGIFKGSALTTATVANGATVIPQGLFKNATNLTAVNLPESITTINSNAFENCTSLKSVKLPSTLKEINKEVFKNDTLLSNINLPEGLTTISNETFANCTSLESIQLPSTLSYVNGVFNDLGTFSGSGLTTATIADGATEIPDFLFKNATNLTTVNLPEGLTTIKGSAFENCTSLKSVQLPSTLKYILARAFKDDTLLSNINLPEGLTTINNNAFENCTSLKEITIPSTMYIDTYAVTTAGIFNNSGVTKATIADGTTILSNGLFRDAINLTTVNLPDSLIKINYYTFEGCSSLTEINYGGTIEAFKASGFRTKSTSQTITVHCSDGDYTVQ